MRASGRTRRATVAVVISGTLIALLTSVMGAPSASALLRWTTYDAGRTAQIGVPDSQVLLDGDGVQTLAWVAEGEILARRSTPTGDWSNPVRVARIDGQARLVGAVGGAGEVVLAWVESRDRTTAVRSASYDGDWGDPIDVVADARSTSVSEVGLSLTMVGDVPCIVASTGSLLDATRPRQISAHVFDGSTWSRQVDPPQISSSPGTAHAFTSGAHLGVTWTQDPGGEALVAFLDPASSQWSAVTVLDTRMPVASPPLLGVTGDAVGSTGALVWGAFDAATGTRTWRYALTSQATVGPVTDLQSGLANSARPVAAWRDGTVWIAGPSTDQESRVWGRGARTIDDTLATPGLIANSTSLAMDGSGQPLMAWMSADPGATVVLQVAQRIDGKWMNGSEQTGARAGGVVSTAIPTLLWQRAVGGAGRGDVVVTSYRDVPLGIPSVQKLRVKGGPTVTVRWKAPADAAGVTGYVVQVRRGKQAWMTRATLGADDRTYTLRASDGTTYRARVAAVGSGERSPWSAVKAVTTPKKPKDPSRR